MKYFIVFYLMAFVSLNGVAQKMNIGPSQANFRYLVSGLKLIDGKYESIGLQTRPEAMDSLIASLKKELNTEARKKMPSDSMKLVLLERLAYSYSAHPMLEERKYSDSIIYYENQKLVLARGIKEADMTARAYLSIWNRFQKIDSLPASVKINLLKRWVNDYNLWIKDIGISNRTQSPHLLLASLYDGMNDDETAENTVLEMLGTAKTENDKWYANNWLGHFYFRRQNKEKALKYLNQTLINHPVINDSEKGNIMASVAHNIATIKIENNQFDDAIALIPYFDVAQNCNNCRGSQSDDQKESDEYRRNIVSAEVHLAQKEPLKALPYLQKLPILRTGARINEKVRVPIFYRLWHQYYLQIQDNTKALEYLQKYMTVNDSVEIVIKEQDIVRSKSGISLARSYETLLLKEKADREKLLLNQYLLTVEKQNEVERIKAEADKRELIAQAENADLQRKIETERIQDEALKKKQQQDFRISSLNKDILIQQRTRTLLLAILGVFVLFALVLIKQNRQKQKANALLQQQRDEISKQRFQLQQSIETLQSTQSQLIQSEKMASLGELTAGIAHEIQNPLNFVNNFSELSVDLAKELKEEAEKANIDKELIIDLATDLSSNQEKIHHHGKRASGIVKSMLEHSRASTGVKEPTDLNALADEYLRLAYHGLRAKDKDFNATMETHFDPDLPRIDVIPQDIGRVLLNLITNAFYAVHQRATTAEAPLVGAHDQPKGVHKGQPYQPTVTISTQKTGDQIIIKVQDNGNGIPESIKDKIFQPFFTTKPTGQGTGLGLSLSYDIVKAHGGELKVETTEGLGTKFIILLNTTV